MAGGFKAAKCILGRGRIIFIKPDTAGQAVDTEPPLLQFGHLSEEIMPAFMHLEHALKSSHVPAASSAFAEAMGLELWDFYAAHPERSERFTQAMRAIDGLGEALYLLRKHPMQYLQPQDFQSSYHTECNSSFLSHLLAHSSSVIRSETSRLATGCLGT